MENDLIIHYNQISENIENEEQREISRLLSVFVDNNISEMKEIKNGNNLESHEGQNRVYRHKIAMVSLRCLRFSFGCELVVSGYRKYQAQLSDDLAYIIDDVSKIERSYLVGDRVISDVADLLISINPKCDQIIKILDYKTTVVSEQNDISPEMFYLFSYVSDYYASNDYANLSCQILENLVLLSRKRNDQLSHRELVVRILSQWIERFPETTYKICESEADYFYPADDPYCVEFLWLYGCVLEKKAEMQKAKEVFKHCYSLRADLYGGEDWSAVIAKREYALQSWGLDHDMGSYYFLLEFIDDIESNKFDEIDEDILAIIEGKTLYCIFVDQSEIDDLAVYDHYLKIYERICERYNDTEEPLIKLRLARNFRGGYYLKVSDYILAEKSFQDALSAGISEEIVEIVTETQIKSNLLLIYYLQNDLESAFPLLDELMELIENDEDATGLSQKDCYRVYTIMIGIMMQAQLDCSHEFVDNIKDFLWDSCMDIHEEILEIKGYGRELMAFVINSVTLLLREEYASREEQEFYLDTLQRIESNPAAFPLGKTQKASFYLVFGILAWNLEYSNAGFYFTESLKCSNNGNVPMITRAAILQTAAAYFGKTGQYDKGMDYLGRSLEELTRIWHLYVRYLNDTRLLQIIYPIQLLFFFCYAVMRKQTEVQSTYEMLIRFKGLASLAGRERNRVIQSGRISKSILDRIRALQDRIASLAAENIFRNTSEECEEEEMELRRLEAEAARQFPQKISFREITWEKTKRAIPDNSAVIEYYFCITDYGRTQFETQDNEEDAYGIDIYITCKENQRCVLNRITVLDGMDILEDAKKFVEILQAQSKGFVNIKQLGEMEDIREEIKKRLYGQLVRPILPYIEGMELLYIAPDDELMNLPFEILCGEDGERLEDEHTIIKIECARDFLFDFSGKPGTKGSLIIGNPEYEVRERDLGETRQEDSGRERDLKAQLKEIHQLPFSEWEVRRIGEYSRSPCYTGMAAAKRVFLGADGFRNIHVATHGYFDLSDETESIYSSCLLFAGVKNWLRTGKISAVYGNGLVTADEVSRMNLETVELVVLSSCLSGMNEVLFDKGFQGMVGALAAAGVRYVISHLWAANDFSTAVLMDAFYYQYMERKQSPETALSLAKSYLRNVTIGQLKQQGWKDYIEQEITDVQVKEEMQRYWECSDGIRPFREEAFWGGFVCYRCN